MALPTLVKQIVEQKLAKYCETKVPKQYQDQIKLSYKFNGNTVFLIESRPRFRSNDWYEMKIAKFKYDPSDGTWELFCADRNDKWHSYIETEHEKDFHLLLNAVEEDVTGIFWG